MGRLAWTLWLVGLIMCLGKEQYFSDCSGSNCNEFQWKMLRKYFPDHQRLVRLNRENVQSQEYQNQQIRRVLEQLSRLTDVIHGLTGQDGLVRSTSILKAAVGIIQNALPKIFESLRDFLEALSSNSSQDSGNLKQGVSDAADHFLSDSKESVSTLRAEVPTYSTEILRSAVTGVTSKTTQSLNFLNATGAEESEMHQNFIGKIKEVKRRISDGDDLIESIGRGLMESAERARSDMTSGLEDAVDRLKTSSSAKVRYVNSESQRDLKEISKLAYQSLNQLSNVSMDLIQRVDNDSRSWVGSTGDLGRSEVELRIANGVETTTRSVNAAEYGIANSKKDERLLMGDLVKLLGRLEDATERSNMAHEQEIRVLDDQVGEDVLNFKRLVNQRVDSLSRIQSDSVSALGGMISSEGTAARTRMTLAGDDLLKRIDGLVNDLQSLRGDVTEQITEILKRLSTGSRMERMPEDNTSETELVARMQETLDRLIPSLPRMSQETLDGIKSEIERVIRKANETVLDGLNDFLKQQDISEIEDSRIQFLSDALFILRSLTGFDSFNGEWVKNVESVQTVDDEMVVRASEDLHRSILKIEDSIDTVANGSLSRMKSELPKELRFRIPTIEFPISSLSTSLIPMIAILSDANRNLSLLFDFIEHESRGIESKLNSTFRSELEDLRSMWLNHTRTDLVDKVHTGLTYSNSDVRNRSIELNFAVSNLTAKVRELTRLSDKAIVDRFRVLALIERLTRRKNFWMRTEKISANSTFQILNDMRNTLSGVKRTTELELMKLRSHLEMEILRIPIMIRNAFIVPVNDSWIDNRIVELVDRISREKMIRQTDFRMLGVLSRLATLQSEYIDKAEELHALISGSGLDGMERLNRLIDSTSELVRTIRGFSGTFDRIGTARELEPAIAELNRTGSLLIDEMQSRMLMETEIAKNGLKIKSGTRQAQIHNELSQLDTRVKDMGSTVPGRNKFVSDQERNLREMIGDTVRMATLINNSIQSYSDLRGGSRTFDMEAPRRVVQYFRSVRDIVNDLRSAVPWEMMDPLTRVHFEIFKLNKTQTELEQQWTDYS